MHAFSTKVSLYLEIGLFQTRFFDACVFKNSMGSEYGRCD
jgi:hypothetical protein